MSTILGNPVRFTGTVPIFATGRPVPFAALDRYFAVFDNAGVFRPVRPAMFVDGQFTWLAPSY